jgi:poly-gamma-glutamate synthesis protein (capsule biosynthesis protein)
MIFVGDIAIPFKYAIQYSNFPVEFYQKKWFGNLEGAIVDVNDNSIDAVYNNQEAINELIGTFDFEGFALANNHIFDTGNFQNTIGFLQKKHLRYLGIGKNLEEASKEVVFTENGVQVVIVNFGWEVIQCEITTGAYRGVNPLKKKHVLDTVAKLLVKYPDAKIIPFMHWSYELEAEPQPFERELARTLIDLGVAGIIGCHPHRIGGYEMYKDKPIVYSLGNWLFKQNFYHKDNLKFPEFCNQQLAFEWDFEKNELLFHFFNYDKWDNKLEYQFSENSKSDTMKTYTPFRGLTNEEYKKWYTKNRYHKRKGLPIYYWEDSYFLTQIKNYTNKLRDSLLGLYIKLR